MSSSLCSHGYCCAQCLVAAEGLTRAPLGFTDREQHQSSANAAPGTSCQGWRAVRRGTDVCWHLHIMHVEWHRKLGFQIQHFQLLTQLFATKAHNSATPASTYMVCGKDSSTQLKWGGGEVCQLKKTTSPQYTPKTARDAVNKSRGTSLNPQQKGWRRNRNAPCFNASSE